MKFSDFIGRFGAYIVAAVLFVAAACIYCSPVLSGKKLYAGDAQSYLGASQESWDYHNETGDWTFWNGAMFSGMPNYQVGGGHYSADDLMRPLTDIFGHRSNPIRMLVLYLVCFFIMLRSFGVNRWVSIAGAFAITLSTYFLVIIPAGHFNKVTTIAMCGVIIGAFNLTFRKKYLAGAVLTAIFVALSFKPHPQMFYYFTLMLGLMWIAEAWTHIREKKWKDLCTATVIFILATAVGIGTGCANTLANAEYVSETMRGRHSDLVDEKAPEGSESEEGLDIEYATQWSYGLDESFSFIVPGFKGGANYIDVGKDSKLYKQLVSKGVAPKNAADFCASAPMYWGDQPFTAGNVYMGAVVCFLFVLGLFVVKGPYKWALLASTVFSIMLAWGSNCMWLTEFFFKYFPMYNKFRAVSSILVVAEVAMPLLGFIALKEIMDGLHDRDVLNRKIWISAGITGGLCLFFALFGGMLYDFTCEGDVAYVRQLPDWIYEAICGQRESILRSDSLRSALFIAAAATVLWLYVRGKLKSGMFAASLCILVLLDMWPVNKRYFNESNFIPARQAGVNAFVMQDYEQIILQDKSYFRVFNLTANTFNESRTSYRLKSIGGYSAAKLRRYNDIIDRYLSKADLKVAGMLNAKYIITPGNGGGNDVQINPYALGNAWFVDRLTVVDNANRECDALGQIDLSHEAVLDRSFSDFALATEPEMPEDATVVLASYTPKDIEYSYSTSAPGTIVFSEIYYPYGWKASIDGKPADHFRVNYLLRAMNVPAGEHIIHFTFDPDSVHKGDTIAVICIIIMYLLLLAAIIVGSIETIRRRKNA